MEQYPEIAGPNLKEASEAAILSLVDDLMSYPPERDRQTYVRTFTLGRTWSAVVPETDFDEGSFNTQLVNPTPYGVYVQDEDFQAWFHVGRWNTAQQIELDHEQDMLSYFEAATDKTLQQIEDLANE